MKKDLTEMGAIALIAAFAGLALLASFSGDSRQAPNEIAATERGVWER
ncbi:MAG: hypothetical protein AAGG69_12040 [Pseudomonadota bacterium]